MKNLIKDKLKIYNKNCGKFSEISNESIDLIITGPPYNIGHVYGENMDRINDVRYLKLINDMLSSAYRVLKNNRYFVIDIALNIFIDKNIWVAPHYIICRAKSIGFNFIDYSTYLPSNGPLFTPLHSNISKNSMFYLPKFDHSSLQVILILYKGNKHLNRREINFNRYYPSNLSDEAYWSEELVNDLLIHYYKKGFTVLDPFLGSGTLCHKVLQNKGSFVGYEKSKILFNQFVEKII